jgi:hypothetical protein
MEVSCDSSLPREFLTLFPGPVDRLVHLGKPPTRLSQSTGQGPNQSDAGSIEFHFHLLKCHKSPFLCLTLAGWVGQILSYCPSLRGRLRPRIPLLAPAPLGFPPVCRSRLSMLRLVGFIGPCDPRFAIGAHGARREARLFSRNGHVAIPRPMRSQMATAAIAAN